MWIINADDTHAKNTRAGCTAFVTAAVIVNDEYETRIESMHDTLDEAKAALSKFVKTPKKLKTCGGSTTTATPFRPTAKSFA